MAAGGVIPPKRRDAEIRDGNSRRSLFSERETNGPQGVILHPYVTQHHNTGKQYYTAHQTLGIEGKLLENEGY